MMTKLFQNLISLSLLFFIAGCKEEYYPKVRSSEQSVLVVEGVINSGTGTTTFRLSRSFRLDDSAHVQPEVAAQVNVEGKGGTRFRLYDNYGTGFYSADQLMLEASEQYRLFIK